MSPKPTVRNSRIPCKNCTKGTLFWNPEEKLYVCTQCGIQEEALKIWIEASEYRQEKKRRKQQKEHQWVLDILGIENHQKPNKKSKREQEWSDIIKAIKEKNSE